MKIVDAQVYSMKCADFEFVYGDAASLKCGRILHLLELKLDNGLSGWGDWGEVIEPGQTRTCPDHTPAFADLIGQDPLQANAILHAFGSQPGITRSMRATADIALWDIRGKIEGRSLVDLLGGSLRAEIPVYASFQNYREHGDLAAWMSELMERYHGAGFRAFKFKIGGAAMDDDQRYLHAARATLDRLEAGLTMPIAVDANQAYTRDEAMRMGRFLDEIGNIAWFEEPLDRNDTEGYAALAQQLNVPIAGAEGCSTPQDVATYLRAGALDIAQPDILALGGITPMRDAIAIARQYDVPVYIHCFYSCLERIAALHLMASQHTGTSSNGTLLEWETACFPARDELLHEDFQPNARGCIAVPTRPGLGVTIRRECIKEFLWRESRYCPTTTGR